MPTTFIKEKLRSRNRFSGTSGSGCRQFPGDEQDEEDQAAADNLCDRHACTNHAPVVALTLDQPEGDCEERDGAEENADEVEAMAATRPQVGYEGKRRRDRGDADWDIDEEDPAPVDAGHHQAAQGRADHSPKASDCAPDPEGGPAPVLRKEPRNEGQRLRREERSADALEHPGGDQLMAVWRQSTPGRGGGADRRAGDEDVARPGDVAQIAGNDQKHAEGQQVGVENPEHLVERRVQAAHDARHRQVDDRAVE